MDVIIIICIEFVWFADLIWGFAFVVASVYSVAGEYFPRSISDFIAIVK